MTGPGGYRERDLIIALYNLESDATWSGDNYSGDFSTLDYVHRTDILDTGGSTTLADLDRRNKCEGPAFFEPNHIQQKPEPEVSVQVGKGHASHYNHPAQWLQPPQNVSAPP